MQAQIIMDICQARRPMKVKDLSIKHGISERHIRLIVKQIQEDMEINLPIMSTNDGYILPKSQQESESAIMFLQNQCLSRFRKIQALKKKHENYFGNQIKLGI